MKITRSQAAKIIKVIIQAYEAGYDDVTLIATLQALLKEIPDEQRTKSS